MYIKIAIISIQYLLHRPQAQTRGRKRGVKGLLEAVLDMTGSTGVLADVLPYTIRRPGAMSLNVLNSGIIV